MRASCVERLLRDEAAAVFLALSGGVPLAFMNVRLAGEPDLWSLCRPATATIDPLGAFVRSGSRARGVGKALLARCVDWCRDRGAAEVHVDFESANRLGSRFWRRHFVPALASVKRSVLPDARDERRRITVVDHDPGWAREFEAEAAALKTALGSCLRAVHHIGARRCRACRPSRSSTSWPRSYRWRQWTGGAARSRG